MVLDIPSLGYSDALVYLEDFLSERPIFGISEDDFYSIATNYNIDTKIEIWY